MKLKPVQTYPPALLKGRVPGELHTTLTAYATYYREATGQTIELWPLVMQMVQQFIDTDRDFEAWRRRTRSGPGAGPATSQRRDGGRAAGRKRGVVTQDKESPHTRRKSSLRQAKS